MKIGLPMLVPTATQITDDLSRQGVLFSTTAENSTACTLWIDVGGQGYTSYEMAESSDTCAYTANYISAPISWYITATDGTDTTTGSTSILDISVGGGGSSSSVGGSGTGVGTMAIGGEPGVAGEYGNIGVLVFLGLGAWLLFGKGKK